ncbi:MAG: chorismate mutase [Bacteroidota bacterium]|nr:chorismate mutase [Bacteroidota bacterium]
MMVQTMKPDKKKTTAINQLKSMRKLIDRIDSQLVNLIAVRQHLAEEIGKIKKQNNLTITNPEREQLILERTSSIARKKKLDNKFVKKVFQLILKQSRIIQRKA